MAFTVSANVWCEHTNDYTGDHWVGGTFESYEDAHDFFLGWMPDGGELREACREDSAYLPEGASRRYEVEVAIWDEDGDLAEEDDFYTETIDWED